MARLTRAALLLPLVMGCSSPTAPATGAPGCPVLDTSCPSTVPSWKGQVEAIVGAACATPQCHGTGGIEGQKINLSTYDGVKSYSAAAITQVNECLMPNQDAGVAAPTLSPANRQVLLSWLVCGAPDN